MKQLFVDKIEAQIAKDRACCAKHGYNFEERDINSFTSGDFIRAVLYIDNAEDAKAFYDGYLELMSELTDEQKDGYTPEQLAKLNIGWCFGEGMKTERVKMWHNITGAAHPVFDAMTPTAEEAFAAGVKMGEEMNAKEVSCDKLVVLEKPYTLEEIQEHTKDRMWIKGVIKISLNEVINNDLEGFLDIISERLIDSVCLRDIYSQLVGCNPATGEIYLNVEGDPTDALEWEDEGQEEE